MAHQQARKPEPAGSGSTNRGFATLDPERQGAPPRQKAPAPRGEPSHPLPDASTQRPKEPREEAEDAEARR